MRTSLRVTLLAAVVAVAVVGCGSDAAISGDGDGGDGDGAAPAGTVAPNGETSTVQAVDNSFVPEELTISAGTEVVWENRGRNEHNIIPEDEDDVWRVDAEDFAPGTSASWVFTQPGTYRYYCSIHGTIKAGMPGVIVVE